MNATLPEGRAGQWLAAGLLAAILAIAWIAVAAPMIGWYRSRAEAINEQGMIAARMQAIALGLPRLERAGPERPGSRTETALIGGATDAIAGAVLEQDLQALASPLGASLSSAEILPPQPAGPYTEISLRIAVSGSWPVLMRLLAAIGGNQPVLLVDDLQINGGQDNAANGGQMNANFVVIAFRGGTVHPPARAP